MQFQRFHATSLIAFVALAAACGGDSSGPPEPTVASVRVTPATPSVAVGATVQLSATALDADGQSIAGKTAVWSTNATGVAQVSGSGLVTGVDEGNAQITATIDGHSGSTTVTVTPPPVASVTIEPSAPTVEAGATVQLSAVLRAADNSVLTGRTVTWTSSSNAVATIGPSTGLVSGIAAGTTLITATSEGVNGAVTLTVTPTSGGATVTITGITPAQLTDGQQATISGSGFSATPSSNSVFIDGVPAAVLSASETSLTIVVPNACLPARQASITVAANGGVSSPVQHRAAPASTLEMDVGEFRLLSDDLCIQLAANANPSEFVFGVQSTAEIASSLTPVTVRAEAATGTQALTAVPAPSVPLAPSALMASTAPAIPVALPDARLIEHRRAHLRFMKRQEQNIAPVARAAAQDGRLSIASSALSAIPSNPQIGDTVPIRVLDIEQARCDQFRSIKTVVRHISDKGIFLADVANPAGGFETSHYQNLGTMLDDKILAVNEQYFGDPGDIDGNGRIAIVFSKEVNTMPALGFVTGADRIDPLQCEVSNFGEVYYSRAPDPTGQFGDEYTLERALLDMPPLLAHELTHIIQNAVRENTPGATFGQAQWEKESQAMLAEEVVGHAFNGYTTGSNFGLGIWLNSTGGQNGQRINEYDWYYDNAVNLALYFGLQNGSTKVPNAPEQCTFLGNQDSGNTGPCIPDLALYTGWSFLRWVSDHYGAQLGGEEQLHRQMIANTTSGFTTLANLTGQPIDVLLAQWAASLYLDDRHAGVDPLVTLPSWNMFEFNTRLTPETGRLTPRERTFIDFADNISVRAPSSAYYRVSGTSRPATAIRVRSQSGATPPGFMRVWVVRIQ